MLGIFKSPADKLTAITRQFSDAVTDLDTLIEECDAEQLIINGKITELQSKKDQTTGAMERASSVRNLINENILGVS